MNTLMYEIPAEKRTLKIPELQKDGKFLARTATHIRLTRLFFEESEGFFLTIHFGYFDSSLFVPDNDSEKEVQILYVDYKVWLKERAPSFYNLLQYAFESMKSI